MKQFKNYLRLAGRTMALTVTCGIIAFAALTALGFIDADFAAGAALLAIVPIAPALSAEEQEAIDHEDDQKFRSTVISKVKSLAQQNEEITGDISRCTKETKAAIEELGKITTVAGEFDKKLARIEKVQLQFERERRMAFGDGIQRICADPEKLEHLAEVFTKLAQRQMFTKAVGEDTSPGQTYILDKDIAQEIYDTLLTYGDFSTLGVRQLRTKVTKFPVKTARAQGVWLVNEAATLAQDASKAGTQADCQVYPVGVLLNASLQIIQDSEASGIGVDIVPDILQEFVQAVYAAVDIAVFNGNGTLDGVNAGITGVFNFGTASVSAVGQMTMETTTVDSFIKCTTAVDAQVLKARKPKWWLYPTMLARAMSIKDTTGRPIFLNQNEAPSFGGIGSILGFPVILTSAAPSVNALSQKLAAFGDPNGFVVGVRSDFDFQWSDIPAFAQYQRAFRGIGRFGGKGRRAQAFAVLTSSAS